jgi:hypothetical protein
MHIKQTPRLLIEALEPRQFLSATVTSAIFAAAAIVSRPVVTYSHVRTSPMPNHPTGTGRDNGAAQQQNIEKLTSDLQSIHAASQVTSAEITQLTTDIKTALTNATAPSSASVTQLKTDLTAVSDPPTAAQKVTITKDVDAVLTSANISIADAQAVGQDFTTIVDASGINAADITLIASDIQAIIATHQAN